MSYLDLILHHHLQTLGCAYIDPSISATFEMHPGSFSLSEHLVSSAFPLEFPQLYQIFTVELDFHLGEEKEVAWN
jgi:hypothetical protein